MSKSHKFTIRKEKKTDFLQVSNLIQDAFKNEINSDHREHVLVENLRKSNSFVPELSLVAEIQDKIVGYILFSKIVIVNSKKTYETLALAPVAVDSIYQHRGIGSQLILNGHKIARDLGYNSVILLGHETYYPRFGYKKASSYDIKLPFDVPDVNCMAIELTMHGLQNINGTVQYPKEFYI